MAEQTDKKPRAKKPKTIGVPKGLADHLREITAELRSLQEDPNVQEFIGLSQRRTQLITELSKAFSAPIEDWIYDVEKGRFLPRPKDE